MARITFTGIDEYADKLAELADRAPGVCKYALYEGAAVVADAIKARIPMDTGDLSDSMALTTMRNEDGMIYTKVVFEGYDSKGTPNALKANVLEKGNSHVSARPFVRPAVNASRGAAVAAIGAAFDRKINEIMNE